ncbi:hypothetical protein [Helicobacter sp. T3_23-1056]
MIIDCHALDFTKSNARNDGVERFVWIATLAHNDDTHPLIPSAKGGGTYVDCHALDFVKSNARNDESA